ncbi:MAG: type II toxin-antitoxin system RelE/ParE family toxin [Bacillota bacterium]|nr:type II toxin-antitoxin system RelE/ParE family toxin [Bacillota bacterium]
MSARLVLEAGARQDLLEIAQTIALGNPAAAQRVKDEIVGRIGRLVDFPELGPLSRDEVLRNILHGARMYRHLLEEAQDD